MFRQTKRFAARFPKAKGLKFLAFGGFATSVAFATRAAVHADGHRVSEFYNFQTFPVLNDSDANALKAKIREMSSEDAQTYLKLQCEEDALRARLVERDQISSLDLDERTKEYLDNRRNNLVEFLRKKSEDPKHGTVDWEQLADLVQMRGKGLDADAFYKQFNEFLEQPSSQTFVDENPDVESLEKLAKLRGWPAQDVSIEGHMGEGQADIEVDLENERFEDYTDEEKDLFLNVRELNLPHQNQREKVLKNVSSVADPPPTDCSDEAADLKCYDAIIRSYQGDLDDPDFARVLENEICWPHRRALLKCAMSRYTVG